MRDFFKEQLVKKSFSEKDRKRKLWTIAIAVAVVVFILNQLYFFALKHTELVVSLFMLSVLLVGIIIFIAYKKIKGLNVEFEYCYTNGELDIDIIRNKAKRKRVFSGVAEEFEIACPLDDTEHLRMYETLSVQDFSSGNGSGREYVFVTTYKGKRKKYVFEPCDEIISALRQDLGSRMYVKR